jgi:hypothetical protein
MAYRVGSESSAMMKSRSVRGRTPDSKIPAGKRHAVKADIDEVLCGYSGPLYIYGLWDSPGMMRASERCEDCGRRVNDLPHS